VMTDEELADLNQREAERMSWCMADVVDIHGDPGFSGRRSDPWSDGTPMIYPTLDPTAEGVIMPEGIEPVPAPQGYGPGVPHEAKPEEKPFILPPEQRKEGKPFILPPEEQKEGKPFILPPDQQKEGKPFLETPQSSQQRPQGARIELQQQNARWQPPNLRSPWPSTANANSRNSTVTPSAGGNATNVAGPYRYPGGQIPGASSPAMPAVDSSSQGVVPAQYQQPYNAPAPAYYPPPYQYPPSYPTNGSAR
jgi:general secretion pathway protein D